MTPPDSSSLLFKDKTILIVDDYPINIELLRLILEESGANVLSAPNGRACLDIVQNHHIDMILMDRNMPVMDGLNATKAIRALPHGADIVIVGISAGDDVHEVAACLEAGMTTVTPKLTLNSEKMVELGIRFFTPELPQPLPPPAMNPSLSEKDPEICLEPAIMDYRKALHEFEEDRELLDKLITDFTRTAHSELTGMRLALDRSDFESIRIAAHGIKGGAANLCAMLLADAAKALEAACKQSPQQATVTVVLDDFERSLNQFSDFVKTSADTSR
jgi:CheY-like chemotaxis protein